MPYFEQKLLAFEKVTHISGFGSIREEKGELRRITEQFSRELRRDGFLFSPFPSKQLTSDVASGKERNKTEREALKVSCLKHPLLVSWIFLPLKDSFSLSIYLMIQIF